MAAIGDLIYLKNKKRVGLVIKLFYERKLPEAPTNALILWCNDSKKEWCLGEALTIIN
jgi:hypothetical protein